MMLGLCGLRGGGGVGLGGGQLSNRRKVSVRNWQGNTMVDIREFYTKDGKEMPGKKGASFFSLLIHNKKNYRLIIS